MLYRHCCSLYIQTQSKRHSKHHRFFSFHQKSVKLHTFTQRKLPSAATWVSVRFEGRAAAAVEQKLEQNRFAWTILVGPAGYEWESWETLLLELSLSVFNPWAAQAAHFKCVMFCRFSGGWRGGVGFSRKQPGEGGKMGRVWFFLVTTGESETFSLQLQCHQFKCHASL